MLKFIAILTMLIDHLAAYLPNTIQGFAYTSMRAVGRIAFPIFAYEIAIGYKRTRNPLIYLFRLIASAVVSEIVLASVQRLTHVSDYPNIFITLSLGLALIIAVDALVEVCRASWHLTQPADSASDGASSFQTFRELKTQFAGYSLPAPTVIFLSLLSLLIIFVLTQYFRSDYYVYGLVTPLLFHILNTLAPISKKSRGRKATLRDIVCEHVALAFLAFLVFNLSYYLLFSRLLHYGFGGIQLLSAFACILFPLEIYSKKPSKFLKYFYYSFYPLHLAILFVVASQTGNI